MYYKPGSFHFAILISICYALSGKWKKKYLEIRNNEIYIICILLFAIFLISTIHASGSWDNIIFELRRNSKFIIIPMAGYFIKTTKHQKLLVLAIFASALVVLIATYLNHF